MMPLDSHSTRRRTLAWLLMFAVVGLPGTVLGEVKLAGVFGDHMVLQRGRDVPVWGTASAGEEVRVVLGKQTHSTKAGQDGRWKVAGLMNWLFELPTR